MVEEEEAGGEGFFLFSLLQGRSNTVVKSK
jgi:hypothetical protein